MAGDEKKVVPLPVIPKLPGGDGVYNIAGMARALIEADLANDPPTEETEETDKGDDKGGKEATQETLNSQD